MKWEVFYNLFLYRGLDPTIRTKTYKALRKFANKNPHKVLNRLPPLRIYTSAGDRGATVSLDEYGQRVLSVLIILPHTLELYSQDEVDFTVAHEFAHVALNHHTASTPEYLPSITHQNQPIEIAADKLAEDWGFKKPAEYPSV